LDTPGSLFKEGLHILSNGRRRGNRFIRCEDSLVIVYEKGVLP